MFQTELAMLADAIDIFDQYRNAGYSSAQAKKVTLLLFQETEAVDPDSRFAVAFSDGDELTPEEARAMIEECRR